MQTVVDSFLTSVLFGLIMAMIAAFFWLGENNKFCRIAAKVFCAIATFYIGSPVIITLVWSMIQIINMLFSGAAMLFFGG